MQQLHRGFPAVRVAARFALFLLLAPLVPALAGCPGAVPPPPPPRPPAPMTSDEPDDGVMIDTMGSLDDDQVESTLRRAAPRLIGCYEQGLRQLPYLAGDIRFHVGVARDGSVKWAFVEATQLGDHAAQQCMLDVLRATTFPRPVGGDSEAILPMSLEPPDAVAYPATWTPNDLTAAVEEHRMELDACLNGTTGYTLTLYVAAGGTVQQTGATPPDAEHQDRADCIAAAARTWILQDPGPSGAKVMLSF
jgi:hypothetical protein